MYATGDARGATEPGCPMSRGGRGEMLGTGQNADESLDRKLVRDARC